MRSVVESLRLNCPRHERVDIHVSLSPAFASTDTSLLSLFCSLNLLKCMLKDSSAFFDLRACPSHKTDTVGTLPSAGSSAPHSLVIRAEAMHSEICISANVNYDWALSLSTRYYLLSVVHPIFWLLHRLESFEENPMYCGLLAPGLCGGEQTSVLCPGSSPQPHLLGGLPPCVLLYFITNTALSVGASQTCHCFVAGSRSSPFIPLLDSEF